MPVILKTVPGETGFPIIGHTLRFMRDCNRLFVDMHTKYGDVYFNKYVTDKAIHLLSPDGNEFVLLDREKNFSSRKAWNRSLKKLFPNGLMLRDGDEHRHHRRLMGAPFKATALSGYVNQMNPDIAKTVNKWQLQPKFLFYPAIKELTLDLAAKIFIGENLQAESKHINQAFVDVVDIIFLMMAAHDTTTSSLSSVCYALAKNPEWQQRIRDDIDAVGADELNYEAMPSFVSADLVLKEALRLYPPLPVIPRMAIKDCEFQGYKINKGDQVMVIPSFTQRMPELWTNPNKFDPERFGNERREDKNHKHAWIPFGGGAHKCLGLKFAELQVKLVLFHILKKYELKVGENYEMPYQPAPIGKPVDMLPLKLVLR